MVALVLAAPPVLDELPEEMDALAVLIDALDPLPELGMAGYRAAIDDWIRTVRA